MANYLERVKDKLQAETPDWVKCTVTSDEKVHVNCHDGVCVVVLDLHKLVKVTDTPVDDKLLEVYDNVVSQSAVLLPLVKGLITSFTSKPKEATPQS